MTIDGKQLSNPFSTGSGGARFEANIQATFVTLMLSGGYAPCLPSWPIVEIKLQGAVADYGTDDLIVFVENPVNNDRRRLPTIGYYPKGVADSYDRDAKIIISRNGFPY